MSDTDRTDDSETRNTDTNTTTEETTTMSQTSTLDPITTRREIVYLFDATDANPNGDPNTEENRPRMDKHTQQALISHVRMNRIVRDYLDRRGYSIFVKASGAEENQRDDKSNRFEALKPLMGDYLREVSDADETLETLDTGTEPDADALLEAEEIPNAKKENAWLATATDVRLFGDAMAFEEAKEPYLGKYTGPIAIDFARSMHEVRVDHDGQTSVLAADTESQQNAGGNMYTSHRIPYALFNAHAVINEHVAAETGLSEEDVTLALDALWTGVHELHSHSKSGHQPRLLLSVEYGEREGHIGDLHRDVSLELPDGLEEKALRDIEDATIDLDTLLDELERNAERLESVTGRVHRRVSVRANGDTGGPQTLINGFEDRLEPEVTVEIKRE